MFLVPQATASRLPSALLTKKAYIYIYIYMRIPLFELDFYLIQKYLLTLQLIEIKLEDNLVKIYL